MDEIEEMGLGDESPPQIGLHSALLDKLWPGLEPPPGFSTRVVMALEQTPAPALWRRRLPKRLLVVGGVAGACAAAAVAVLVIHRASPSVGPVEGAAGEVHAGGRQTVRIGERGIAVAEAGASLVWSAGDEGVHVDQRRGTVFYRVERGGPFIVATEVAQVRVTGTCFQVEVESADGAGQLALEAASALVVRVFEGGVRVGNDQGEAVVAAGERVRVRLGEAPSRVASGTFDRGEGSTDLSAAARTAAAQARVRELERSLAEARRAANLDSSGVPPDKYFDFTPEELKVMAKRCDFRYTLPEHLAALVMPELETEIPLSAEERAGVIRVMQEQRSAYVEELRSLFMEVVGDRAAAQTLSPMALQHEISSKSTKEEEGEARRRLYQEWSGQVAPPTNLGSRPAIERYWRLQFRVTDDFVRRVSDITGPDRARELGRQQRNQMVGISGDCEKKGKRK
jgi:hypothetical protein